LTKTRALAFQPYFDAGFPHGFDRWMAAAGTSWATMALTLALPEVGPETAAGPSPTFATGRGALPKPLKNGSFI